MSLALPPSAPMFDALSSLDAVSEIAHGVLDILHERVDAPVPPSWSERRGWTAFLLALPDDVLTRCEAEGLAAVLPALAQAPGDLRALALAVSRVTALPSLNTLSHALPTLRSVSARKQQQLAALLGAISPLALAAARIVDVGAGSGHLTNLAASLFDRQALGIERNDALINAARARAEVPHAQFVARDACQEPLGLQASDLAIGLHACGEVGDKLSEAAGDAGCDLALVTCCLQKISTSARLPLSGERGVVLRKDILGLGNLTAQAEGVERDLATMLRARQSRFALWRLLRARGLDLSAGEAMKGINRRRAVAGLEDIAQKALALRGLAPASTAELRHHAQQAERDYGMIRRLSLPRHMLSRLVELSVVLDRAARVQRTGSVVLVATLFDRAVSPRNTGIFASRHGERLPAVHTAASAR